jgi:hypothetical protein
VFAFARPGGLDLFVSNLTPFTRCLIRAINVLYDDRITFRGTKAWVYGIGKLHLSGLATIYVDMLLNVSHSVHRQVKPSQIQDLRLLVTRYGLKLKSVVLRVYVFDEDEATALTSDKGKTIMRELEYQRDEILKVSPHTATLNDQKTGVEIEQQEGITCRAGFDS